MSAPKTTAGIKVPPFTRDDFGLWKMKMLLFIKASNPLYIGILENGPYVPMKSVDEMTTPEGNRIPAGTQPKDISEYTDSDKELIRLDTGLMLILTDSADKEMSYQIMSCTNGKHMWDTINLIMEGTEDVQENRLDILTSQYESFRSLPGESITQVFEKYTKLLNELAMKGKTYPLRETNRKFMMMLPHHVEHKSSSIRERIDFTKMSLEMIYGKLKTYEMEQEQRVIIYGSGTVDNKHNALARSAALVVDEPTTSDIQVQTPRAGKEVIIESEMDSGNLGVDESDYYTLEELEQMEDKTMAYLAAKFSHIRFNRIPKIKSRCYNCNELGHFATECQKPRQARDRKGVYEKRDSYEDLKKENAKLKQQVEALSGKQKGKAYIAEGKHWDDTDSDEEEEYVNVALMADSSEESPQLSQVTILTTIDMSNSEYKKTVQDLSVELFNVHTSMLASEMENAKLVLKIEFLESKNEELELVAVTLEDLKQKNVYLENKNSALIAKEIIDTQTQGNKTAIGLDYTKKAGKKTLEFPVTSHVVVKKNIPHILKNVEKEMKTKLPRNSVKTVIPKTEVGDSVSKSKKNRNGKKKIVSQEMVPYSLIASRKLCTICNSAGHLTHACKKVKVETANTSEMHNMSDMPDLHEPRGKK
ncbi:hypothetical protein POM88_026186 [Heracleum sosnowskyi]|uniref:CCHC-type domain-containing protein n=1 Tax=Heracleum sosnowskyi TaxID=360622 RepID=A0AAD8MNM7_9APIA|nr:hypothetical protein POM88_026186 [Heracleum sosnowskyi]